MSQTRGRGGSLAAVESSDGTNSYFLLLELLALE